MPRNISGEVTGCCVFRGAIRNRLAENTFHARLARRFMVIPPDRSGGDSRVPPAAFVAPGRTRRSTETHSGHPGTAA